MIVERNVRVPMRDGIALLADVYRPRSSQPCPAVLIRTCYTKVLDPYADRGVFWTSHGYVFVVQDVRGLGDSGGEFYPLVNETDDGSDTLDWIADRSWSDGRVVMAGGSYLGLTQAHAACSLNAHLAAAVLTTTPGDPDRGFPLSHGLVLPAAAFWLASVEGHLDQEPSGVDIGRVFAHKPIVDADRVIGRPLRPWRDWIDGLLDDGYWEKQRYQQRLERSEVPMLHVSGWYDDCLNGALENFSALSRRPSCGGVSSQRLLIGPWLHGTIGERRIGETDFGEAARLDLPLLQRDWFDTCLKGEAPSSAAVRLFVMGRNAWIDEDAWPIARTEYVSYYLHSEGNANTRHGDGMLSPVPPGGEPPDRFRYDPADPTPYGSHPDWKQIGGPDDCASVELRRDVLVYTSRPFEAPVMICGPLRVRLFAATTAVDTDWMAKVVDVHPDGKAVRLNDGAVRARFRKGHQQEVFLVPGAVEEYAIDCWATCIELQRGHRIRLEICSSAFGKFDVNLNGGGPVGHEVEPVVAYQTVYHDAARPSCLILPIVSAQ